MGDIVIVGGTSGIGRALGERYAQLGKSVILTGRDQARAESVAAELASASPAGKVRGLALDLSAPTEVAAALSDVGEVDRIALVAIERDANNIAEFDIAGALRLVTLKLVGYSEVVHTLASRIEEHGSLLLFGGAARERPYPGSTTMSTVNAGVTGLTASLAAELSPVRVNSLHPGLVVDTPAWSGNQAMAQSAISRTLTKRLVTMRDVVDAAVCLLENPGLNNVNLPIDGGWL
ncbi:SDR family oxidoreductase [Streptomyces sp. NPDC002159]